MSIGETFNTVAYQQVAEANTDLGTVMVFCNNSSHYLVGRHNDGMPDNDAVLEGSYAYSGPDAVTPHWPAAYRLALNKMTEIALRYSIDDDDAADDASTDFGADCAKESE